MEDKLKEIIEYVDRNRHECDLGCDNGCDKSGDLSSLDVDELLNMLWDLED